MRVEDLILRSISIDITSTTVTVLTQLTFGSRNLHQTPSSRISFILRHLLRNTASILLRRSMIDASSFAFVGLAA